jgi:hypothetical protein
MPKSDNWIIAQWQRNGSPVFVRMAAAYRGMGQVPGYAHKVAVAINLRDPEQSGLPRDGEHQELEAAELAICGQLEAGNESLCVLAITGCGTRDLIFYTRDPVKAQQKIKVAQSIVKTHTFEASVEPDDAWQLYGFFDQLVTDPALPDTETSASA